MALSIDWGSRIINVPKDYTAIEQLSPTEIRSLDVATFHWDLKDLEDNENGMPNPDTHFHQGELSFAGITFARIVQIINGYTVTFEDGQYAVNILGGNSNIADVTNVNSVSVRSFNSAGLISTVTAEEVAEAVLTASLEGNITQGDAMRIMLAVLAGKSTGGGTATIRFRDVADSKNRVVAAVDSVGNRTEVTTRDGT